MFVLPVAPPALALLLLFPADVPDPPVLIFLPNRAKERKPRCQQEPSRWPGGSVGGENTLLGQTFPLHQASAHRNGTRTVFSCLPGGTACAGCCSLKSTTKKPEQL